MFFLTGRWGQKGEGNENQPNKWIQKKNWKLLLNEYQNENIFSEWAQRIIENHF